MKKRLSLLLFIGLAFGATAQNDKGFEISKNLEIFANVYKNLHTNYVDDVDPGKTMKVAIDAMLASMDPYTNYYAESDMEDVKMQVLGQYGGIGSLIHQEGTNIYVAEPYEGLPADKAGLKIGDRILAVNGESTEGKNNAEVSAAMRGQAGTKVTLRLEREGKTFDVTITRAEIRLPNVSYSGIVNGNIGYIRLDEFTQNAAKKTASEEQPKRKLVAAESARPTEPDTTATLSERSMSSDSGSTSSRLSADISNNVSLSIRTLSLGDTPCFYSEPRTAELPRGNGINTLPMFDVSQYECAGQHGKWSDTSIYVTQFWVYEFDQSIAPEIRGCASSPEPSLLMSYCLSPSTFTSSSC